MQPSIGITANRTDEGDRAHDASRCVVLVPATTHVEPACEAALVELAGRGYTVRRVYGYAAIDQARNDMATAALADGFEDTVWIDSDIFSSRMPSNGCARMGCRLSAAFTRARTCGPWRATFCRGQIVWYSAPRAD